MIFLDTLFDITIFRTLRTISILRFNILSLLFSVVTHYQLMSLFGFVWLFGTVFVQMIFISLPFSQNFIKHLDEQIENKHYINETTEICKSNRD